MAIILELRLSQAFQSVFELVFALKAASFLNLYLLFLGDKCPFSIH